jgi:uncharacterized protein (TIGR03118 family)
MKDWLRPRRTTGARKPAGERSRFLHPCLEELEARCLLATGYALNNLASDVPGLAAVTDPNLVNPWGISFNPTGFFWFSENGTGVSDLLNGSGAVQPLVVGLPSGSNSPPTGTVFNPGSGFAIGENGVWGPSRFLFATEYGMIDGWNSEVDLTHTVPVVDNSASGADYTGLALAADPNGQSFLYAANFRSGSIDVFDQNFQPVHAPGAFRDPNLPAGFSPFNIQNLDGRLFVTYAQRYGGNAAGTDLNLWPGAGRGILDVYDSQGGLVQRFASGGSLNAPWGLALAPAGFGSFSGDLLVGNNGDGHINAYDPNTGAFLGQLTGADGTPLALNNLWGLTFGNGHLAGASNTLFFTAGIDSQQHGLFGSIRDPGSPTVQAANPTYVPDPADAEYPVPPDNGPSLPAVNVQTDPSALLLALTDSPLVLVPTLFSAPGGMRLPTAGGSPTVPATPVAGPGVFFGTGAHGVSASDVPNQVAATGEGSGNGLLPLESLLNLGPSINLDGSAGASPSQSRVSLGETAFVGEAKDDTGALPSQGILPVSTPAAEPEAAPAAESTVHQGASSWHYLWNDLLGKLFLLSIISSSWYYLAVHRPRNRDEAAGPGLPQRPLTG